MGDISPPTERVDTGAGTKSTTTPADISSPTENVGMRAGTASNTVSLRTRSKSQDKKTFSEENKQFGLSGEGGEQPPPWNAAVMVVFSFPKGSAGPGVVPVVCVFLFFPVCSVLYLFIAPFRGSLLSDLKNMRGDADQVADVRNRRASIFLPINPLKIITTVSGSAVSKYLGNRIDFIWFGSVATLFLFVAI